MIKNLPNYITCLNLVFGCLGLLLLFNGHPASAAYCIWIAAVCDFFDGFAARAVKAESPMGKELDSLADVVSFGVLPAFLWFHYITDSFNLNLGMIAHPLSYIAFFMAVCSAWRLAKFNIDTRQTDHFRGVPTPANALVWSAIPFITSDSLFPWAYQWISNPVFIIVFGLVMSVLLVMDIPLIAFKFKDWSWKSNKIKYSFLLLSVVLLVSLKANGIFFVFAAYLGASFLENKNKGV
ncbi:MAG: pssA [Cytophagaceae bacterium]|jgi:CDP-diacylglycerol--serine O-phosphatidyltransferase|nr:pssA [Cytophagaceae bacterium]